MIKEVADKFETMLISQVESTKKIKTNSGEVKKTVESLLNYVRHFNSKGEFDSWILGRHQSEIKVISEIASLVYPSAVRLNVSDLRYNDLIVRNDFKTVDESKLSYAEFIRLQNDFRRYFKSDINERTVTLESLRSPKNLSEVLPYIALLTKEADGKKEYSVHYQNEAFIPLPLSDGISALFSGQYWNASVETVVEHYVRDMK